VRAALRDEDELSGTGPRTGVIQWEGYFGNESARKYYSNRFSGFAEMMILFRPPVSRGKCRDAVVVAM
jgi:hypothetical protein